jgi:hypothetical protein
MLPSENVTACQAVALFLNYEPPRRRAAVKVIDGGHILIVEQEASAKDHVVLRRWRAPRQLAGRDWIVVTQVGQRVK